MSNLVERLRSVNEREAPYANYVVLGWCHEAAAEITRLRAVNAELVEALEWALAELDGRTQYSAGGQHERCLVAANYALSKAKGEA